MTGPYLGEAPSERLTDSSVSRRRKPALQVIIHRREDGAEILSAQGGEQLQQDDSDQASLAARLRALKGWDARAEAELVAAAVTAALGRTRRDD